MRRTAVLLLAAVAAMPASAAERDPTILSAYQAKALTTLGVAAPPADAVAIAAMMADRELAASGTTQSLADSIVEDWTRAELDPGPDGQPCDVTLAACSASARANARLLTPVLLERTRDMAVLFVAVQLAKRYPPAELATLRTFIATPAGSKTPSTAFMDRSAPDDPRWKPAFDELDALRDSYRRRFRAETSSLPRAKPPVITIPMDTLRR